MNPLSIVQYIVERLDGSPFAPFVNVLLCLIFVVAVGATISALLRKPGRDFIAKTFTTIKSSVEKQSQYSPPVEAFRAKAWPYVNFTLSVFIVLLSIYSFLLVGWALLLGYKTTPWYISTLAALWLIASIIYTRIYLATATWAWHRIRGGNEG